MGLLDDAIREHLELKRRRGADPAEIERAERDALGPVRRAPEPAQSEELEGQVPLEAAPADYEEQMPGAYQDESIGLYEDAAPVSDEQGSYEDHGSLGPFPPELPMDNSLDRPTQARPEQESYVDHGSLGPFPPELPMDSSLDQPTQAHPAPHAAPASPLPNEHGVDPHEPPPAPPTATDHTVEYDVEHEQAPEGEDVLEETPEFLQDTPDHDRLWFEQRPPREFDFDE